MILKRLYIILILFGCTLMYGQQDVLLPAYPKQKLRAGFVFTDLISNRIRADLDYRISGPNVIGIGLGAVYGTEDMDNTVGESLRQAVGGFYTNLSHKYYFAASQSRKTFHYTRITAAYQNANVTYYGFDFVPYVEDGLTFLEYREVEKIYNAQTLGLQLEIGMEFIFDNFFMELGFGMKYNRKVSNDFVPSQFNTGGRPFDIDYTGVTPTLACELGVYLDY